MKKWENVSYQKHNKTSHCVMVSSRENTLSYSVKQLTSAECSDPEAANSEAHALL